MSKKSTPPTSDSTNRPVFLGALILAAGAYSTWYWYKPLPDLNQSVSSSPWEQDRSSEWNWTDSAVLRPTLEDLESTTAGTNVAIQDAGLIPTGHQAPPPELPRTGSGLLAAPNFKWQINAATQLEPPPKSPEIHIPDEAIVGTVKPWVDYETLSEPTVADVEYNWPSKPSESQAHAASPTRKDSETRAILSSGSLSTPRAPSFQSIPQAYHESLLEPNAQPPSPLPPSVNGFEAPRLLETDSKRIRITDDESASVQQSTFAPSEFTAAPKRIPHFIRQPK